MTQQGYLLVANITDYMQFFVQSELDHAQEIIKDLVDTLLKQLKPPLTLAQVKQNTLLFYAPSGSFITGQTFLEAIEQLYYTFRMAREQMRHNTSCDCQACQKIPTLDLSFIVHYGEYLTRNFDGHEMLSSADVMLVQALVENSIDLKAYAFITEVGASKLQMNGSLPTHSETTEHHGTITGYVEDLQAVWEREHQREERRVRVEPDEAWITITAQLTVLPALAWDYLNDLSYRQAWLQATSLKMVDMPTTRTGIGTAQRCAHGQISYLMTIVDWQPFEYVTYEIPMMGLGLAQHTLQLTPTEQGTQVDFFHRKPAQTMGWIMGKPLKIMIQRRFTRAFQIIDKLIEADKLSGKIMSGWG